MERILKLCKWTVLSLLPLLLVALLLLGYFALNAVEREPLVIFAGGGSVKNYIDSVKNVKIDKETFPNSVYINLPSGYVPTLLKEEIERFKKEIYDNHSFLYICLSAEKIDSIENKNANARVFEDSIGVDSLVVYFYMTANDIKNNGAISVSELDSILNLNKDTVYATSRKSGTYNAYFNAFKKNPVSAKDTSLINNAKLFFEEDSIPKKGIILSSQYYPPKRLDRKNYKCVYIKKGEKDSILTKPLYVYFVAYEKDGKFVPNTQILEFLNMIHDCAVSKENWEEWVENKKSSEKKVPIKINSLWK